MGDETSAAQPVVCLSSAAGAGADVEDELKARPILFMLPGVEDAASILEPRAENLEYQAVCLQLNYRHGTDNSRHGTVPAAGKCDTSFK
jgi:hypothetical protein